MDKKWSLGGVVAIAVVVLNMRHFGITMNSSFGLAVAVVMVCAVLIMAALKASGEDE